MTQDSRRRTIAKTCTFRVIVFLTGLFILKTHFTQSDELMMLSMNGAGMLVYYLHDRAWLRVGWGNEEEEDNE